jgi:uncharacterized protein YmfQ (DUF2313 family)
MFDQAAYADQLKALMPTGPAWAGEDLSRLLEGIAAELARIDARAVQLLDEADPRSALELLADWERTAGLPDACFGMPDNVPERQVAVSSRITSVGGQSRAYFTELAASLGYVVSIDEFRQARCGDRIGTRVYGEGWAHVWRMNVLPPDFDVPEQQFYVTQARCGDRCGKRLRGWGAINLECLVSRHKPAHSVVLFSYQIEPDPLFWFDFTQ